MNDNDNERGREKRRQNQRAIEGQLTFLIPSRWDYATPSNHYHKIIFAKEVSKETTTKKYNYSRML
jgi:hypothetical protein